MLNIALVSRYTFDPPLGKICYPAGSEAAAKYARRKTQDAYKLNQVERHFLAWEAAGSDTERESSGVGVYRQNPLSSRPYSLAVSEAYRVSFSSGVKGVIVFLLLRHVHTLSII